MSANSSHRSIITENPVNSRRESIADFRRFSANSPPARFADDTCSLGHLATFGGDSVGVQA